MFCKRQPAGEVHHVFGRGLGGWKRADTRMTCLPCCGGPAGCHDKCERGAITKNEQVRKLAFRNRCSPYVVREFVWTLEQPEWRK